MSLERVSELRKLIEQGKTLKARSEAAVEQAEVTYQEAMSKLQAAGVSTTEEALKAAAEARESVQKAIGKVEAKLKEAIKRD